MEDLSRFIKRLNQNVLASREGAAILPTTLSETVLALNPSTIDGLSDSSLARVPILRTLEEAQIPGTSMRYVLVHDELGPSSFVVLSVMTLDLSAAAPPGPPSPGGSGNGNGNGDGRRGRLEERSRSAPESRATRGREASRGEVAKPPRLAKILFGGHPLLPGNYYLNFRDTRPTPSVAASFVRAGYRLRKLEDIPISIFEDFCETDLPRLEPLEHYGYVRFQSRSSQVVPIHSNWSSLDDYLREIPAASRRVVERHRTRFERGGLSFEAARPTPIGAELTELYRNSPGYQGKFRGRITAAFFDAAEQHIRKGFRLFVVRKDHRIVAFVCALADENRRRRTLRLVGLLFGVEPELDAEFHLRANLFYRLLEDAVAGGFRELDLGRLPLRPEGEFGVFSKPLYSLIRHRNPGGDPLMKHVFHHVIELQESP